MKLHEIIDTQVSKSELSTFGAHIGSGAFYNATASDDPHTIIKTSYLAAKQDEGFKLYADFIIKHKLAERNPFFPRIYQYRPEDIIQYEVERLMPFTDLDYKELEHIFAPLIGDTEFTRLDQKSNGDTYKLCRLCILEIKDMTINQRKSKSKLFNQAMHVIKHIADSYKGDGRIKIDIHAYNIMFRRTNAGAQLVLNDPLAILK